MGQLVVLVRMVSPPLLDDSRCGQSEAHAAHRSVHLGRGAANAEDETPVSETVLDAETSKITPPCIADSAGREQQDSSMQIAAHS